VIKQPPKFPTFAVSSAFANLLVGIRIALGAQRTNVLWLIPRDAVVLVLLGAVIGLPVAFGIARFVSSFLYRLTARDPVTMILATAALGLVTVIASFLPARRASKVDPMVALRYE